MNNKYISSIITALLLFVSIAVQAQGPINDSLTTTPAGFSNDTTTYRSVKSNTAPQKDTSTFAKHSPKKATLLSVFLPGAGQAYNKKYWKMPLVYAAAGTAVYGIIFYSKQYNDFRSAYNERLTTGSNVEEFYNRFQTPTLKNFRDSYRYYRDLSYIGLGAVYLLQIVDAAVDAHFFDFKITDDLSLNVQPTYQFVGATPSSQLLFTFKF
jgi:hypothetical protein